MKLLTCALVAASLLQHYLFAGASPRFPSFQETLDARLQTRQTRAVAAYIDSGKISIIRSGCGSQLLDEKSRFQIGSISSVFVSAVYRSMLEDHTVNESENIKLPNATSVERRPEINFRDLSLDTRGFTWLPLNVKAKGYFQGIEKTSVTDLLASLLQEPGAAERSQLGDRSSMFSYSLVGPSVLAAALAQKAARPYSELLKERLLNGLGMRETRPINPARRIPANFESCFADAEVPEEIEDFGAMEPSLGYETTIADLAKFADCVLMGSEHLSCDSTLLPSSVSIKAGNFRVGFVGGWFIEKLSPGAVVSGGDLSPLNIRELISFLDHHPATKPSSFMFHQGDTPGYHSVIVISKEYKRAIVVLSQGEDAHLGDFAVTQLARSIYYPKDFLLSADSLNGS
jgi:CubicO group peptidase (beta-lactamase class C family)